MSEGEEKKEGDIGSDSFIIDTSEISSSDGGAFSDTFGHAKEQMSTGSTEVAEDNTSNKGSRESKDQKHKYSAQ
jgi:hypothetical protein